MASTELLDELVPDRIGMSPQELHVLHSSRLGTMLVGCGLVRASARVGSLPKAATDPAGWDRCGDFPAGVWAQPAHSSQ
jgi:hypothetical protein